MVHLFPVVLTSPFLLDSKARFLNIRVQEWLMTRQSTFVLCVIQSYEFV